MKARTLLTVMATTVLGFSFYASSCAVAQTSPAPPAAPASPETSTSTAPTFTIETTCLRSLHIIGGTDLRILDGDADISGHKTHFSLDMSGQPCAHNSSATIQVPYGTNIYADAVETDITISGVDGNLTAKTYSNSLKDSTVRNLSLDMNDSGDVSLNSVNGAAMIKSYGSGDLTVDALNSPATNISTSGSGDITINSGQVGALKIRSYSSGDIKTSLNATTADLESSGSGDISVDDITGPLHKRTYGSGSIVTGASHHKGTAITFGKNQEITLNSSPSSITFLHLPHHPLLLAILTLAAITFAYRVIRNPQRRSFKTVWLDFQEGYATFTRNREARRNEHTVTPSTRTSHFLEDVIHTARQQKQRHQNRSTDTTTHPALYRLNDRLARLEPRLAKIESYVSSPNFSLERQFHDLEHKS